MKVCVEGERKGPFASCSLCAFCKPIEGPRHGIALLLWGPQATVRLLASNTPSSSGFYGRCCPLYKQSEFSTPNYLGLFTSVFKHTPFGNVFTLYILVFTSFYSFFCWHLFSHREDFELMSITTLWVPKQLYMGKGNSHSSSQRTNLIKHSWSVNLKHKQWPPQNNCLWSILKAGNFKYSLTQNTPKKTEIWKQEKKCHSNFNLFLCSLHK